MDASTGIKPVGAATAAEQQRPAAFALQGPAATELPEGKVIPPTDASNSARNDTPRPGRSADPNVTHTFVIDPQTREMIYRVIDVQTRQVLWQVPDVALSRSRAYAQALKTGTNSPPAPNSTDVTE
jgi:hypothetical protein